MREHIDAMPRSVRVAALLMLAVPAVLWLFLVWDTRPYSREEIEADRAATESSPAYAQAVKDCESSLTSMSVWTGNDFVTRYPSYGHCREQALEAHSSLTRQPVQVGDGAGNTGGLVLTSMAAAMLLVGVRWRPTLGARSFLRDVGKLFLHGTLAALVVGWTWWWALGWIAERRGVLESDTPMLFIVRGALLVGLIGVVGLALKVLLRGPLRVVATLSTAAVVVGAVALMAHPLEPWLPMLNVEAFLSGDEEYRRAVEVVVSCDHLSWPGPFKTSTPASPDDVCTSYYATRTFPQAALYLFSSTLILTAAAALASVRRRGRGELGGPDPRRRVAP